MSKMYISHVTYRNKHIHEEVMWRIWAAYVTYLNESRHTYDWCMSHRGMSDVIERYWSRCRYDSIMTRMSTSWPHIRGILVTNITESCHTYECLMRHIWMRHGTHMAEWQHTHEWEMPHIWSCVIAHINSARSQFQSSSSKKKNYT
jgi:hypothetical protein